MLTSSTVTYTSLAMASLTCICGKVEAQRGQKWSDKNTATLELNCLLVLNLVHQISQKAQSSGQLEATQIAVSSLIKQGCSELYGLGLCCRDSANSCYYVKPHVNLIWIAIGVCSCPLTGDPTMHHCHWHKLYNNNMTLFPGHPRLPD